MSKRAATKSGLKKASRESGDNSGEDTPVPISNTEVKLSSADDTWREAAWESRTLPVKKNGLEKARLRLHGQAVKTPPFHGGNPGSIPGGVTRTCAAFLAAFELYAEVAQG